VIQDAKSDGAKLKDEEETSITELLKTARGTLSRFAHSSWAEHSPLIVTDEWKGKLCGVEYIAAQSQVRSQRAREKLPASASQQSTSTQSSSMSAFSQPSMSAHQHPSTLLVAELQQSDSPSMGSLLFGSQAPSPLLATTEMLAGRSTQCVSRAVMQATTGSGEVRLAIKLIDIFILT
jgi:hypothetical protein